MTAEHGQHIGGAEPAPDETDDPVPSGQRRCLVTRAVRPKSELLRFVVDPTGQVVPDVDGRLPGRGLWLSPGRDMIEIAARRRLFSRAARQAVTTPPDLADQVEHLLTRRCLRLLGLARRAGQVVAGYEKVRARVRDSASGAAAGRPPPAILFAARDGASDGRARMAALAAAVLGGKTAPGAGADGARGANGKGAGCRLVVGFDAEELGQPLGRDRAVHVSLDRGRLAKGLLEACTLLSGFRPGPMVISAAQAREMAHGSAPGADPEPQDGATDARGGVVPG